MANIRLDMLPTFAGDHYRTISETLSERTKSWKRAYSKMVRAFIKTSVSWDRNPDFSTLHIGNFVTLNIRKCPVLRVFLYLKITSLWA